MKFNGRFWRLLVVYFGSVALMLVFTNWIGRRYAADKARSMLDYVGRDFMCTMNDYYNGRLLSDALAAANSYEGGHDITIEDLQYAARCYNVTEINIADASGCWILSSTNGIVGTRLDSDPNTAEFLKLLDGSADVIVQDFRPSVSHPEVRSKYVGVPLPNNAGILQMGLSDDSMQAETDRIFRMLDTWEIGETGFFIYTKTNSLVIANYGVYGDRYRDQAKTMTEAGVRLKFGDSDWTEIRTERVFGEPSWLIVKRFASHYVAAVLPHREFNDVRAIFNIVPLLVLTIGFAVFVLVMRKVDRARLAEERLHAEIVARLNGDIRLAAEIQQNSLPHVFPPFPEIIDRFDLFAAMKPARVVGGDFYDFRRVGQNKILFAIADVSGKGVSAAMFMMRAKTMLLGECMSRSDLASGVESTNRMLCDRNEDGMFVTAWVGLFDLQTGRLRYVNAGHNPPIVRHENGTAAYLADDPDLPMAALPVETYVVRDVLLADGDMLITYTDGVVEAANKSGEFFGEERLLKLASGLGDSVKSASERILKEVDLFTCGAEQSDDITILCAKLHRPAGAATREFIATRTISHRQVKLKEVVQTFAMEDTSVAKSIEFVGERCPGPDVAVIVDEIASNIVRCSGATSFSVTVRGSRIVEFSDDGVAFNPLEVEAPDVDLPVLERPNGRLGLFIVQELSESVTYRRTEDGRNVLTITLKDDAKGKTR